MHSTDFTLSNQYNAKSILHLLCRNQTKIYKCLLQNAILNHIHDKFAAQHVERLTVERVLFLCLCALQMYMRTFKMSRLSERDRRGHLYSQNISIHVLWFRNLNPI